MSSCSVCGATKEPLALKCKYCGTSYVDERDEDVSPVNELKRRLEKIDEDQLSQSVGKRALSDLVGQISSGMPPNVAARLDAINTFTMPTDTASLLKMLLFCHGNASIQVDAFDNFRKMEREAWLGKAKMAYGQLKGFAHSDEEIKRRIQEYEAFYGVNAKKRINLREHKTTLVLAAVGLLVVVGFYFGITSEQEGEAKEHARIEQAIQRTQELLVEKQYEAALLRASDVVWRERPSANEKEVEQYDRQRQEIIAAINAAKSREERQ